MDSRTSRTCAQKLKTKLFNIFKRSEVSRDETAIVSPRELTATHIQNKEKKDIYNKFFPKFSKLKSDLNTYQELEMTQSETFTSSLQNQFFFSTNVDIQKIQRETLSATYQLLDNLYINGYGSEAAEGFCQCFVRSHILYSIEENHNWPLSFLLRVEKDYSESNPISYPMMSHMLGTLFVYQVFSLPSFNRIPIHEKYKQLKALALTEHVEEAKNILCHTLNSNKIHFTPLHLSPETRLEDLKELALFGHAPSQEGLGLFISRGGFDETEENFDTLKKIKSFSKNHYKELFEFLVMHEKKDNRMISTLIGANGGENFNLGLSSKKIMALLYQRVQNGSPSACELLISIYSYDSTMSNFSGEERWQEIKRLISLFPQFNYMLEKFYLNFWRHSFQINLEEKVQWLKQSAESNNVALSILTEIYLNNITEGQSCNFTYKIRLLELKILVDKFGINIDSCRNYFLVDMERDALIKEIKDYVQQSGRIMPLQKIKMPPRLETYSLLEQIKTIEKFISSLIKL